jgi:hypothetical protein
VPAAAVKRGGQALFVLTGRKGFVDGFIFVELKVCCNDFSVLVQYFLSLIEISGTLEGGVKSVDIVEDHLRRRQEIMLD